VGLMVSSWKNFHYFGTDIRRGFHCFVGLYFGSMDKLCGDGRTKPCSLFPTVEYSNLIETCEDVLCLCKCIVGMGCSYRNSLIRRLIVFL